MPFFFQCYAPLTFLPGATFPVCFIAFFFFPPRFFFFPVPVIILRSGAVRLSWRTFCPIPADSGVFYFSYAPFLAPFFFLPPFASFFRSFPTLHQHDFQNFFFSPLTHSVICLDFAAGSSLIVWPDYVLLQLVFAQTDMGERADKYAVIILLEFHSSSFKSSWTALFFRAWQTAASPRFFSVALTFQ